MSKQKNIYICEECGREHDNLLFPESCKCGNYCEDFFRLKDLHDYEDDKACRPLLGIKYDPEVLKAREARLENQKNITQEIAQDIETIIDFESMNKKQLINYLIEKKYIKQGMHSVESNVNIEKLIQMCKKVEIAEIAI